MNVMSPSDIVGPSPVTSNGTETTEIEDDASDEIEENHSRDVFRPSEVCNLRLLPCQIDSCPLF